MTGTGIVERGRLLAIGLALVVWAGAVSAQAKSSYTVTVGTMDLGIVVPAATGDTQFRINNTSGGTTVIGTGGAARASSNDARSLVTVSCASVSPVKSGDCPHTASDTLSMQVAYLGGATNRLEKVDSFTVYKGSTNILSGPTGTTTISFTISAPAAGSPVNFYVAGDVWIWGDNSGKNRGDSTASFTVTETGSGAAGLGTAHARADRKLSISLNNSGMAFGALIPPKSGTGTVTLSAASSSTITPTGGAAAVPGSAHQAAQFTVTGEGGQAVSISAPAFPAGSITITPIVSAAPGSLLSGAINSQGSLVFYVGGSFNLPYNATAGTFNGTLSVTADYQ